MATTGLHDWVMVQEYLNHLPLYRIAQISCRYGAGIAISTLAEWVGKIGVTPKPSADRLAELLRQRQVQHADEIPVP